MVSRDEYIKIMKLLNFHQRNKIPHGINLVTKTKLRHFNVFCIQIQINH